MEIDSENWRQTVIAGAAALGVTVSAQQAWSMGRHALELLQWNRAANLTAITDPLAVAIKHCVDALAVAAWIDPGARVLDAGSGGGFPGIPLAIVRPDLALTLVDSVRKKVSFLKHVIRTLGLTGIDAVHGRLEALGESRPYARQFDLVVCRAFASLSDFTALALPFLAPGGSLLAMRGRESDPDGRRFEPGPNGSSQLGDTALSIHVHRYRLPLLDAERSIVRLTPGSAG
ncbi:MAG: 16S rRNA (guanine(527)-N(7))-methyltransferase RsmG [Desulfosarcina sp.]